MTAQRSIWADKRRGLETAEKLDIEPAQTTAYTTFGLAYLLDEQPAAARDALREGAGIIRERRARRAFLPEVLALLAEAHVALGERTEVVATAREGIELGRAGGGYYFEAQAQLALAAALPATDGVVTRAEIESALERAEQLVESIEGRSLSPRVLEQRGRLAAAVGDAPASSRACRRRWTSTAPSAPAATPNGSAVFGKGSGAAGGRSGRHDIVCALQSALCVPRGVSTAADPAASARPPVDD